MKSKSMLMKLNNEKKIGQWSAEQLLLTVPSAGLEIEGCICRVLQLLNTCPARTGQAIYESAFKLLQNQATR